MSNLKAGFSVSTAMSVAGFVTGCRKANLPQLEAMLKQNPKLINARNDKGRTGLMMAAYEGMAKIAEVLLQIPGKDFNFTQHHKRTFTKPPLPIIMAF